MFADPVEVIKSNLKKIFSQEKYNSDHIPICMHFKRPVYLLVHGCH